MWNDASFFGNSGGGEHKNPFKMSAKLVDRSFGPIACKIIWAYPKSLIIFPKSKLLNAVFKNNSDLI